MNRPLVPRGEPPLRNGPREHVGAISLLPIFVHPADSPETHANKGAFQKLLFSCSRWARSGFSQAPTRTKQLRKNENSTTDFPQLFWPKTTSDDKDQKRKKTSEGCRADPRKATTNHGHTDLYCEPSAAQRARTQQARQTRQQQTSGQETKNDPTSGHLKVKILIQPLNT